MGAYIFIAQTEWELFEYILKFAYPWASRAGVARRTLITMLALLGKIHNDQKKSSGTCLCLLHSRGNYRQYVFGLREWESRANDIY